MFRKAEVITKAIRFLALVSILMVLFPYQVSAAGVGASPSKLDFNIHSGGSATKSLYVINTGASEAHYKVYVDDEYKDWFDFAPREFSLVPQASQRMLITASPSFLSLGSCETYLYILTTSSSSALGIDVGIRVPIHIHIFNPLLPVGIGVIAALTVALVTFLMRRKARGREVR